MVSAAASVATADFGHQAYLAQMQELANPLRV
jgi:hypothetical protein